MGRRSGHSETGISLGVRSDRQLLVTDRTRRGLAATHAWRRPGPQILDRRGVARQARSLQGACALARAVVAARTIGARRIRPERRLYLRRHQAQRSDHFALRGVGYILQFRDDQDFGADAGDENLVAISAKAKARHARASDY